MVDEKCKVCTEETRMSNCDPGKPVRAGFNDLSPYELEKKERDLRKVHLKMAITR